MKTVFEHLNETGIFEFEGIGVEGTVAEKGRVTLFISEAAANTYADINDVFSGIEAVLSDRYKYWEGDCRYLPTLSDLELIIAQEKAAQELDAADLPDFPVEPVKYVDSYSATASKREDYGVDYFGRRCERKYVRETFISEGGDSIRDASEPRVVETGNIIPGKWRLV